MPILSKSKVLIRRSNGGVEWVPLMSIKPGMELVGETMDNHVINVHMRPLAPGEKVFSFDGSNPFFTESTAFAGEEGWLAVNPIMADLHLDGDESKKIVPTDVVEQLENTIEVREIVEHEIELSLPVTDLELDGDHTFYVEHYLVHNFGGGSSGGGNTTTVTKSDPPAYLQPYLTDLAARSSTASHQVSNQPYGGQLVATPNANELGSQNTQAQIAQGTTGAQLASPYNTLATQAQNEATSGSLNRYLDQAAPIHSANTSGVIQAAIDPLKQDLMNNIIPGIKSDAISSGAYGGSRQGLEMGSAVNDFERNAQNTAATINYQDLARTDALKQADIADQRANLPKTSLMEQNLMSLAPQLATQGFQASLMPSDTLNQVGVQQQLQQQDALDAAYAQWQMQQMAPFAGLPEFSALLNGSSVGGTNTSTAGGGSKGGGFSSALSGGLGGLMAGQALSMGAGATAGMGGAGMLLALLSDRRLKSFISKTGEVINGLSLYRFKYLGSDKTHVGFMADEVEVKVPAAVSYMLGYRTVNYGLAIGG